MAEPNLSCAPWTVAIAVLSFIAQGLGYSACVAAGVLPSEPAAWGYFAVAAVLIAVTAIGALQRFVLRPLRLQAAEAAQLRELAAEIAAKASQQRQTRHDLRGALSPALLSADRLLSHADPAVKRSGDIVARSVERAIALISDGAIDRSVNPPAG